MSHTRVVGIIPARGGSKGIANKNLQRVGGVPLIGRAVLALSKAIGSRMTFVSTDSSAIAACARTYGANVIDRPESLAGAAVSSEAALLHALEVIDSMGHWPEILVFVQCTSPFLDSSEIAKGVELIEGNQYDSVFSAARTHTFHWRIEADGTAVGVNHDHLATRKRRQDLDPEYRETGAFYVMRVAGLRTAGSRFFGRIGLVETNMPAYEVDDYNDLIVTRALAAVFPKVPAIDVSGIGALIMDFDGVHTDDSVIVLPDGTEAVTCSRRDGMGLEIVGRLGVKLLILSKERNGIVKRRAEKLGVACLSAVEDKELELDKWLTNNNLSWEQIAFIGNDVNDVACMRRAGLSFCPRDAHESAKSVADMVLDSNGGRGAIRELCDLLVQQGRVA